MTVFSNLRITGTAREGWAGTCQITHHHLGLISCRRPNKICQVPVTTCFTHPVQQQQPGDCFNVCGQEMGKKNDGGGERKVKGRDK